MDTLDALDVLLEQLKRDNRSLSALQRVANRVVFVPWTLEDGARVIQQAKETFPEVSTASGNGKVYVHLNYQPWKQHEIIRSLSEFDEIYLVGHGHPVSLARDAFYTGAQGESGRLPYEYACDRLIRSGLRPDWSGDLKIFSCYSANCGAMRFGERSLASVCASYLKEKGYACKVYGYESALRIERRDGHKVLSNQTQFPGERLSRHRVQMFTEDGPNRPA